MTARHGEGRAAVDLGEQGEVHFRGMLQIRVHDAQNFAARRLPPADDRRAQPALALAADDAHLGVLGCEPERDFPRPIGAVVVDDDELVRVAEHRTEQGSKLPDEDPDVLRFVERGNDQ